MAEKIYWQRVIPRYVMLGIIGSLLVVTACSAYQIWLIKQTIRDADTLFQANSVDAALGKLLQTEIWAATRYPVLAVELNIAAIKCHVKRKDMRSAEETARKIYDGKYNRIRLSRSIAEYIQNIPNFLIVNCWKKPALTRYSGYEELVNAVRQSGNYERLVSISRDILNLDPSSSLAQKVKAYIPVDPATLAKIASAAPNQPPPVVTNKVEETPRTIADHRKLLDKLVTQKEWEKALKECEIILTGEPDDAGVLEIRKLAAAGGMRWAAVRTPNAPSYDISGKFLKAIPAGHILDVANIIKTSREELALCSMTSGNPAPAASFLMRVSDLSVYFGNVRKLGESEHRLFRREAELTLGISALRKKLASTAIDSQNPHAAEYREAKQAYDAYWAKVRDLQKKRDSATADNKITFSEELRKLKGEDIRVGMALDSAKKKYDQSANNVTTGVKSPELDSMESELSDVRDRIKSIDK